MSNQRNITEYTMDGEDGTTYFITEIHPEGTPSSDEKLFKKVRWTHRVGFNSVEDIIIRFLPKVPKKRVYFMTNRKSNVLLGVYPKLTKREREILALVSDKINKSVDKPAGM